jgi:hypothetical protein
MEEFDSLHEMLVTNSFDPLDVQLKIAAHMPRYLGLWAANCKTPTIDEFDGEARKLGVSSSSFFAAYAKSVKDYAKAQKAHVEHQSAALHS